MAGTGTGTQVPPIAVPSINIDAWFDEVVPAAQLCPNPIIRRHIINVCRDFCRRTELWEVDHLPIDVVADEPLYQLSVSGIDIVGAERAEYDGQPLGAASAQALDADTREKEYWRTKTEEIPKRFFVDELYRLRLIYIPTADKAGGLTVVVNAMPLEGATEVPIFIYNQFKETIATGVKARLKMIPDMPWTDFALGAGWSAEWEQLMIEAEQKKYEGFQHVKTRDIVRTHYWDF